MQKQLITVFLSLLASIFNYPLHAHSELDWHTQSNYQQIVSTHVQLDLVVDFDKKQLSGFIEHQLKSLDSKTNQLKLDTRDLSINKVELWKDAKWQNTDFTVAPADPVRGSLLTINIQPDTQKVRVYYHSNPQASGLQWLTPEQTAGKKYPFMFSQSQAIHARSWMPIQDTPGMRVTYSATIKTDKNLRPVMSANNNPERNANGVYHFEMPQPIPPYLIAIAAGDIHHKVMSKQTGVYSEPAYLEAAAEEFSDTQAMIEATEKMYGAYRWNQYDLLVLPPSFPFGGMENPRLSFITPTVIAGDKSLVSLIAHELAHSWSGNLVTNATWRDLWLNEGFTSYVENRIMESVYGSERAVMEQALGVQDLKSDLAELDEADTILNIVIEDRDPDDAFSNVPYVKGQLFLMFLEQRFGRKTFDTFLKKYFNDHAFQSLDTAGFIIYLNDNLIGPNPDKVTPQEIYTWIFQPNLPKFAPNPISDVFEKVQVDIDNWMSNESSLADIATGKWTVHEWLYFINNLPEDISLLQMAELDKAFNLTESKNNEIAHAWLLLSIKQEYAAVNNRLENYLMSIGRRKLIVPLYKALLKNENTSAFAIRVYQKARAGYHPLAQGTIDEIIKDKK